jgi:hypothetical protein
VHMWFGTFSFDVIEASHVENMRDSFLNSKIAQHAGLAGRMRQPMTLRTKALMAGEISKLLSHCFRGLKNGDACQIHRATRRPCVQWMA